MTGPHQVSVVIPVYQGERTLAAVVEELAASVAIRVSPGGRQYQVAGCFWSTTVVRMHL